ncbi:phospholipid/glycerol acyltransferase [Halalkalibacter wakoensis JCM 9140]|uniref:Phospholipid/glycerol acyltransferase n=1 Tax=Halalkalibacter wakoensis JCM 9140 TaxID=1236970 RepID=W4Q721_9BACI|nr:lysophospholipid acyltransferase family protein [Halalkalibacter wakoensis]GAE27765.1 phospholipid/glycerol acyltransferase [Halalkalibacter wakoensis JCM 9140]
MIIAKKSIIFQKAFHLYNVRLLKKSFYSIYLYEQERFQPDRPVLFLLNHSSWWDGLVSYFLSQSIISSDSYVMMSEEGLTKYPFFRKLGAYSVTRQTISGLKQSLTYTETLLKGNKSIWMFPQGEEQHLEKRPLHFQEGAAFLAKRLTDLTVVPITYYYSFGHEQQPDLYIQIGSAIRYSQDSSRKQLTSVFETTVTNQLNKQRGCIIDKKIGHYSVILHGKPTISERFTSIKNNLPFRK